MNRAKLEDTGMNGQDPQTMENVAMLTKALRERDEQIEQLQENLSQASKEIESSAALIESLTNAKKKGGKGVDPIQKSLINVRAQLQKSEEKIAELEESLKEAEDAAKYVVLCYFVLFFYFFSINDYLVLEFLVTKYFTEKNPKTFQLLFLS